MIIYDSTNPDDIPTTASVVAGYVDGIYAWSDAGWLRFPNAAKISIAVSASSQADALDVETGDATPSQAPGWVNAQLARGVKQPWVYVNRSNRWAVESACQAAGIQPTQMGLWVATLDGTQSVPAGPYPVAAVQYANSATSGGHYDLSITTAYGDAAGTLTGDDFLSALSDASQLEIYNDVKAIAAAVPVDLSADLDAIAKAVPADLAARLDAIVAELDALKAQVAALPVPPAPVVTATVSGTFTGTVNP